MSKSRDILFEAQTPLGFTVRVTKEYWAIITTLKHPVMAGCEAEVQGLLESPEEIRRSKKRRGRVSFLPQPPQPALGLCREQAGRCAGIPDHGVSHRRHQRRRTNMAEVNVYYDPKGRTLTVWFGRPQSEYTCEETGDEVILMKDRKGRVIGFERLNYPGKSAQRVRVAFETVPQPA